MAYYWSIGFLTWQMMGLSLLASPLLLLGAWLGRRWFALALIAIAIAGSLKLLLA